MHICNYYNLLDIIVLEILVRCFNMFLLSFVSSLTIPITFHDLRCFYGTDFCSRLLGVSPDEVVGSETRTMGLLFPFGVCEAYMSISLLAPLEESSRCSPHALPVNVTFLLCQETVYFSHQAVYFRENVKQPAADADPLSWGLSELSMPLRRFYWLYYRSQSPSQ